MSDSRVACWWISAMGSWPSSARYLVRTGRMGAILGEVPGADGENEDFRHVSTG